MSEEPPPVSPLAQRRDGLSGPVSRPIRALAAAAWTNHVPVFRRHNGSLANGDKGRRRSRLALHKRPKANGVRPDVLHNVSTPLVSKVRRRAPTSCRGPVRCHVTRLMSPLR